MQGDRIVEEVMIITYNKAVESSAALSPLLIEPVWYFSIRR